MTGVEYPTLVVSEEWDIRSKEADKLVSDKIPERVLRIGESGEETPTLITNNGRYVGLDAIREVLDPPPNQLDKSWLMGWSVSEEARRNIQEIEEAHARSAREIRNIFVD